MSEGDAEGLEVDQGVENLSADRSNGRFVEGTRRQLVVLGDESVVVGGAINVVTKRAFGVDTTSNGDSRGIGQNLNVQGFINVGMSHVLPQELCKELARLNVDARALGDASERQESVAMLALRPVVNRIEILELTASNIIQCTSELEGG